MPIGGTTDWTALTLVFVASSDATVLDLLAASTQTGYGFMFNAFTIATTDGNCVD